MRPKSRAPAPTSAPQEPRLAFDVFQSCRLRTSPLGSPAAHAAGSRRIMQSGSLVQGRISCTQCIFLHLAHRVSWQFVDDKYALGELVAGQSCLDGVDDLRL